jgi:hypothetical protein
MNITMSRPLTRPNMLKIIGPTSNWIIAAGIFATALFSAWPVLVPPLHWASVAVFDAVLLGIAILDLWTGQVSKRWIYPIVVAGLVRNLVVAEFAFFPIWLLLLFLYSLNIAGGADVKLLMGLFALWPNLDFALCVSAVHVGSALPVLAFRYLPSIGSVLGRLFTRLVGKQWLPTEADHAKAVRFIFSFCLAGMVYPLLPFILPYLF